MKHDPIKITYRAFKLTAEPRNEPRRIERGRRAASLFTFCGTALIVLLTGCGSGRAREDAGKMPTNHLPLDSQSGEAAPNPAVLTGKAAMGDWTTDAPGVRRRLAPSDMPPPHATDSARNHPRLVDQPPETLPLVPPGFQVNKFAGALRNPRQIKTAPNGDLFVAESEANRVRVLRDANGDGRAEVSEVFADHLKQPFGIAFYPPGGPPQFVYVANTDSIVRFPYQDGDTQARGESEVVVSNLPSGGRLEGGGHWTRDIVFSKDGAQMYVSVGSKSNNSDDAAEARRARIFVYTPEGKDERVYAHGIRNPVGLAIDPGSGELWASVNERDELGDNLAPDYITRVTKGGFYGWPWYYIGGHQDPRHEGKHPELKDQVVGPDVLIQAHSASLGMTFYSGEQFPSKFRQGAFAAEHGSWNRERRTGYKVIFVPTRDGRATGEYIDFMTGFVTPEGNVWGRPVGVAVGHDGALFVTDDASNSIWRITYPPAKPKA